MLPGVSAAAPQGDVSTQPLRYLSDNTYEECAVSSNEPSDEGEDLPPTRSMLIPMTVVFQGYAGYVVLQHYLKEQLGAVGDESKAEAFTAATTLMHWGKLLSRVGHDVFFVCLSSYARVLISMLIIGVGVVIPPLFVYRLGYDSMSIAYVHFFLVGVGVGVFEGTFLSVIGPLGKRTKLWAIQGAPLGLAVINIVCQTLKSKSTLDMSPEYFYWYIVACIPIGMIVFARLSPRDGVPSALSSPRPQANVGKAVLEARRWLPGMMPFFLAKVIGSFVMENTPGWFYVYNGAKVPLFSPSATTYLMDKDLYFVVIYIMVLLGDGISRRVVYYFKLEALSWNLFAIFAAIVCSLGGFYLESLLIAAVTWVAAFFAFWGNGLNYAVAVKHIDRAVPTEHTRAVYSLWLMVGDAGGILGALAVTGVNKMFCHDHYTYVCVQHQ